MLLPQLIAMLALPVEAVSASHCLHLLATRLQCLMTWLHSVRLLSAFHFADSLSPFSLRSPRYFSRILVIWRRSCTESP